MCAVASRGSIARDYKHAFTQFKYITVKLTLFQIFFAIEVCWNVEVCGNELLKFLSMQ